ncbi:MAG: hypothetical protein K5770_12190 [Lachnospiraceae bacterium]|nr:hypothetical protein [Lachnospiraceae bacterium]
MRPIFLSNFSEQHYSGNSDYNSAEYAHFALEWMELNKYKEIDTSNGDCRIDQAQINKVLERYFGTILDESDFYNADVNNVHNGTIERGKDGKSNYCEPAAEGELYRNNAFSVVWQMEDLGSGNKNDPAKDRYLRMYFTVYSLPDEVYEETGIGKKQYSLNEKDAEKEASKSELFEEGAGFAIVNEVSPGEYRLMYYYLYHQMMEP